MSALSRCSMFAATLAPAFPALGIPAGDPVFAAIAAARAANDRHVAMCRALHDDDSAEAEHACNEAADTVMRAIDGLARLRPTTHAGLVALVQFYADDAEGTDSGASYLRRLVDVLKPPLPS